MSCVVAGKDTDLLGLSEEQLVKFVESMDEPPYRARQIMRWMYHQGEVDIDRMTDLPKAFRAQLELKAYVGHPKLVKLQESADGTRKFLFELNDGVMIESVLIRDDQRLTACVSSQAGCGIGCSFCATGLSGLHRNLSASEIIGQLVAMQKLVDKRITNVVMMGMGEPLANYRSVMQAIRLMIHPLGMGIGQRHITVSTSGVIPGIIRLAEEDLQIGLAVSLHAPTDAVRDVLVPLNKKYPIDALIAACDDYGQRTGRRITVEYVMIRDVNDSLDMANALGKRLRPLLCHVNLIPLNPVAEIGLERSTEGQIQQFASAVRDAGVAVTVRKEMGKDIDAACGQLRQNNE